MQTFNYHSHTYRCGHADLDMLDEDYVKEYLEKGFQQIAFTDHCPEKNEIDKVPKVRMPYSQKEEYLASIKKLKEKYAGQIEIKTGYEVEYLPGEEKNIQELKDETDILILGQHFIYKDKETLEIVRTDDFTTEELLEYANYIEKAMELGIPDIVAHPDFFMRKRKNCFGEAEERVAHKICKAAQKYQIPLEINLNNIFNHTYYTNDKLNEDTIEEQKKKLKEVEYPCQHFWKIATQYDIKVLYGIDVHHRGQILRWNELVELAKEVLGKEIIEKLNFIES